ncbi:MAG TPA: pyruvate dehydrogenase (acetyl-transferring), homodimeric type, partial [Candidatus Corynebacterium avicola]|nr:pyruvate dehydrogenase (acetyl-transferring), homodimeric type [Candidatus Corynebacterium avicola]
HGEPMIPLYIFYSMFGFQRTGDGIWAAADQMARGFLIGATAGRTTLTGEGLQHMDGHSHLLAATNPAVVAWDPAFGYEIAYIVRDGIQRMYGEGSGGEGSPGENVIYYLTAYNEPVHQPAAPEDLDVEGLLKGIYLYSPADKLIGTGGNTAGAVGDAPESELEANILASGVGVTEAIRAKEILQDRFGVRTALYSVTSWTELAREGAAQAKEELRHPDGVIPKPFVTHLLDDATGPFIGVSDFATDLPEQIRAYVPGEYTTLGTDGFGFSDTRAAARRYFNSDAESIVVAVLSSLARAHQFSWNDVRAVAEEFNLTDPTKA